MTDTKSKAQMLLFQGEDAVRVGIISLAVDLIKATKPTKGELTVALVECLEIKFGGEWNVVVGSDMVVNLSVPLFDVYHIKLESVQIVAFRLNNYL